MPRSFLIKKTDSPTQEVPDGQLVDSVYDENDILSEQDIAMKNLVIHNNNFLPYLAAAASVMRPFPTNIDLKKDLYNEFFVLDDPSVWKLYKDRQPGLSHNNGTHIIEADIKVETESSDKVPSSKSGELSPKSSDENEKVYQCQFCNKSFTRSWNFQRHVLIHTGRKPHKCDKCPKAFVLAAHLKIHNRIHTGEKPYKCNICGRGFAQLTNLQRHVLTHTGEKPHKCTYCGKGFVSSSDLRRHVRIHTGEKPYQCKICSKAFTTSGNLQSHVLTHTGEKPYQCDICNWKFISSSNLRTHLRTHHFREDMDTSDE
ncbi:zinc finger protein 239-like [Rhopilema esculentum]|uniref:zinc finger protein 239-like n=1 Tax=Rhopilema esculentum TaxID=499914 RepID=UPI0031E0BDCA|eukprot:gene12028-2613_t